MKDPNEGPLSNACIIVFDPSANIVAYNDGVKPPPYCFDSLASGGYTVKEKNPTGYVSTTSDEVSIVNLLPGTAITITFGDQLGSPPCELQFRCAWTISACVANYYVEGELCNTCSTNAKNVWIRGAEDKKSGFVDSIRVAPNHLDVGGTSCKRLTVDIKMNQNWFKQPCGTVVKIRLYAEADTSPNPQTHARGTELLMVTSDCNC